MQSYMLVVAAVVLLPLFAFVAGMQTGKRIANVDRLQDLSIIESYYLPTSLNEGSDRGGQCCIPIGVVTQLKRRVQR